MLNLYICFVIAPFSIIVVSSFVQIFVRLSEKRREEYNENKGKGEEEEQKKQCSGELEIFAAGNIFISSIEQNACTKLWL